MTNTTNTADLRVAAQAVIDRWDTPTWKDAPATAEYIGRLRAALAAPAQAAAPGAPSDATRAVHEACGKIIKTLAAIVNSPQSCDQFDNEVLQRDSVMAKVMAIKSQVDAIYKAVPLPIHPYMRRQQAAATQPAAPSGPAREPLADYQAYALIDSMGWQLDDSEKDDMLKLLRAVESAHGITAARLQLEGDHIEDVRAMVQIAIEPDEVLVALKRPECYEDVHPELVAEDLLSGAQFEYRVAWPVEVAP